MHAPQVLAQDLAQGFLLLADLGTTHLPAGARPRRTRAQLFADATDALIRWQLATRAGRAAALRRGAAAARDESLPEWYVGKHLQNELSPDAERNSRKDLRAAGEERARAADGLRAPRLHAAQPDGVRAESRRARLPGRGARARSPTTWCRCCATPSSAGRRSRCSTGPCATGRRRSKPGCRSHADFAEFWRAFEWMGLQRHLKVLGIFARIHYRDGKPKYLAGHAALPRLRARRARRATAALAPLAQLLDELRRMKAMILAAGPRRARCGRSPTRVPKPLVEAGGKPLIAWHLERLRRRRLPRGGDQRLAPRRAHRRARSATARAAACASPTRARPQPLETAGGIAQARCRCSATSPFLLVNADVYCECRLSRACARVALGERLAHLVLVPNPRTTRQATSRSMRGESATPRRRATLMRASRVISPALVAGVERRRARRSSRRCCAPRRSGGW